MGRLAWVLLIELSFGFLLNCRSLAGMAPLVPFDGDAGSRARHRPLHLLLAFSYFGGFIWG